jgi:ABC-type bacteriocin/lantibiotic exporter with double-glycine peptidase domain
VYGVQIGHNTYQWFRQPKHYGSRLAVQVKLDELKVKYRITGNDMSHVAQAAKATGCMVFIKPGAYGSEGHAVLVTDTTDKTVRILDPNTVQEEVVNKDWFLYYWDGLALTVTK